MSAPAQPTVTDSVVVDAAPEAVYALLTDLSTLAELASEVQTMHWRRGGRARPGAVFAGRNTHGAHRWTTECTVTDALPGRTFAFEVRYLRRIPISQWRYDLEPEGAGCRVTESTRDCRWPWLVPVLTLGTGVSDRAAVNAENIRATLARLKERAEAPGVSGR